MENEISNQINCEHDWRIITYDQYSGPGVAECKKCGLWLYHSNRLQLEMNRYTFGFQKKIAIGTLVISIVALIISIAVAVFK
ncbi:MAG: hypothetical protein A3J76_03025 [Candidatus Moranbacteria bacterium RBG_13_45_13]|nr:MAG: hypothetical protein A3J76_03025 [Candidatus Moranbacteria bacterium RBG_13_45_13]